MIKWEEGGGGSKRKRETWDENRAVGKGDDEHVIQHTFEKKKYVDKINENMKITRVGQKINLHDV